MAEWQPFWCYYIGVCRTDVCGFGRVIHCTACLWLLLLYVECLYMMDTENAKTTRVKLSTQSSLRTDCVGSRLYSHPLWMLRLQLEQWHQELVAQAIRPDCHQMRMVWHLELFDLASVSQKYIALPLVLLVHPEIDDIKWIMQLILII